MNLTLLFDNKPAVPKVLTATSDDQNIMRNYILVFLILCSLNTSSDAVEPENFEFPTVIKRGKVMYPTVVQRDFSGGVVEILTMVDTDGKSFAPMILRSTNKYFDKAALNSLADYKFEPAILNGKPVESYHKLRIKFEMEKEKQAVSKDFSRYYRRALTQLDSQQPDLKKVDAYMKKMRNSGGLSTYALSYYYLVAARRASVSEDHMGMIEAGRMLLFFESHLEESDKILDSSVKSKIIQSFILSLAKTQRYSEAIAMYEKLRTNDEPVIETVRTLIENIKAHLKSDAVSVIAVTVDENKSTLEEVFEKNFSFFGLEGELKTFNLRCDTKFKEMEFLEDVEYRIPDSWGRCRVEFKGDSGAKFNFAQY